MKFDRFGQDVELSPWDTLQFPASPEDVRECAVRSLQAARPGLPRLTKQQAELIVKMVVESYDCGWREGLWSNDQDKLDAQRHRTVRAVAARRRKSKRHAIAKAFEEAAATGAEVTVESLSKRFEVSPATVYRALNATCAPAQKISRP